MGIWESELIPDRDALYMRVHRNDLDEGGNPIPGAFRNRPKGGSAMSTDWDRYSSPRESKLRAANPELVIVIGMGTGAVRQIPGQSVFHTPDLERNNRAHTDVRGEKTTEARAKFISCYRHVLAEF